MSFHSLEYLLFLPLAVLAYFLFPKRLRWVSLLAASLIFYASWRVEFLALILFSTTVDYSVARLLSRTEVRWKRRVLMGLSVTANLGLLAMFKFFTQTANEWFQVAFTPDDSALTPMLFLLPLGISFYTFQTLGYTIDVFRGKREPEKHFGKFAVYVMFFPQLIAGPIERAARLMPQLKADHRWDWSLATAGAALITVGMFKKLVIADGLSHWLAEGASAGDNTPLGWTLLSVGTLYRYYCDLSGYADMAIGSALFMGIKLSENFRRPMMQGSVTKFWRTWHITVSNWFRDYYYMPVAKRLGHLRFGRSITVISTMLVVGVWHGATINWMLIGLVGGIIISISNWTNKWVAQHGGSAGVRRTVAVAEFAVLWLYIPFLGALILVPDFYPAMALLGEVAHLPASLVRGEFAVPRIAFYLPVAIIALELFSWLDERRSVLERLGQGPVWLAPLFYLAVIAIILVFGTYDNPDFLYFEF